MTPVTHTDPKSLVDLLRGQADARPNDVVYRFLREGAAPHAVTFGELDARARAMAAGLRARVARRAVVWLIFHNDASFIACFFGCLYADVIAVPIAASRLLAGDGTLAAMLADSAPSAVLAAPPLLEKLEAQMPQTSRAGIGHLLCDDACAVPNGSFVGVCDPRDIAYLQYTSGSTSTPRGVMITHANVVANLASIQRSFAHDAESVGVSWLPHYHDMGLVYGLLQPIFSGHSVVVLPSSTFARNPAAWLQTISQYGATHSGGPNFAYDLCVRRIGPEQRDGIDLRTWRVAFNGAEPVRWDTMNRFAEAFRPQRFQRSAFFPAYGLAEATLKVSGGFIADSAEHDRLGEPTAEGMAAVVGCGSADADTQIVIVNPEDATEVPHGGVGEIWVAGPGVAKGYWNRPADTDTTFGARLVPAQQGPFLRTGDLGFVADGQLFVTGRLKELLIVRGQNYYPHDIEAVALGADESLRGHSAAAFLVAADRGSDDERLVLVCEVAPRDGIDVAAVADAARARVAAVCGVTLHSVCCVKRGAIPKTSSGKLRRLDTRALFLAKSLPVIYESVLEAADEHAPSAVAPSPDAGAAIAARLRQIVSAIVRRDVTDADDSRRLGMFGLDSLGVLELLGTIETEFATSLSLAQVLKGTIGTLAHQLALVDATPATARGPEMTGAASDPDLAAPEQERLWLAQSLAPESATYNLAAAVRLRGPLDVARWERAVRHVEERHESLRTTFAYVGGALHARVLPPSRDRLVRLFDAAVGTRDDREDEARALVAAAAGRPFRLEREPPLRAMLIRLDAEDHIALFVLHHIASDVWSVRILLREVGECYDALAQGRSLPASSQAASYREQMNARRASRHDAAARADERYWVETLHGAQSAPLVPFTHDGPRRGSHPAGTLEFTIAGGLFASVQSCAGRAGVTPFVVLLSALRALAWQRARYHDFVVGVPVANRLRPASHDVIGLFAQPAAIRVPVRGDETFDDLLARVASTMVEALSHQRLPFVDVMRAVDAARGSRARLPFSTMFGFHDLPHDALHIGGVERMAYPVHCPETDVDLFFDITVVPHEYRGSLTYDAGAYSAEAMMRLVDEYVAWLNRLVAHPSVSISALDAEQRVTPAVTGAPSRFRVVVASTFVAEPLAETFSWWCRELGADVSLDFAPEGQLVQQLTMADSSPRRNANGVNVLLLRMSDWHGDAELMARFLDALAHAVASTSVPYVVYVCPVDTDAAESASDAAFVSRVRAAGALVVTPAMLAALYPVPAPHARRGGDLADIPYIREYFAALATHIVRTVVASTRAPFKLLAVDCDGTLWGGTCGEGEPEELTLSDGHRAMHAFLLERQQQGVLLALCSKNNAEDVERVFRTRRDLGVTPQHVIAWRVNWTAKSANILDLCSTLGLAPDSVALLDDDPRECAEVAANCPAATTVRLPGDSRDYAAFLAHYWALDVPIATEESRRRTALYRDEGRRRAARAEAADLTAYLAALDIRVTHRPIGRDAAARAAELSYRTTQLNTSGQRWTQEALAAALESAALEGFVTDVDDRYGSYGTVGVALYRTVSDRLEVVLLALSCRALGRGVEEQMVWRLVTLAQAAGCREVTVSFTETRRNRPARDLFGRIGAREARDDRDPMRGTWTLPLPFTVPAVLERAGAVTLTADADDRATSMSARERFPIGPEMLRRIASELRDPAVIAEHARAAARRIRAEAAPARALTAMEAAVAATWTELLNVDCVDPDEDFFALGGDSLIAVQILAQLRARFGVDLPVELLFDDTVTVAKVARFLEDQVPVEGPPPMPIDASGRASSAVAPLE